MSYLFSPFGCVGRGGWWLFQFLFIVYFAVLVCAFIALGTGDAESFHQTAQRYAEAAHQGQGSEFGRLAGERHPLAMVLLFLSIVLVAWSSIAIEIKRWHDLDMTGWCVLLRLVPFVLIAFHIPYGLFAGEVYNIALVVVLGFWPGACASGYNDAMDRRARSYPRPGRFAPSGPHLAYPAQPAPSASSQWGSFALGCLFALFLVCAVGAAYYLGRANLPSLALKQPDSSTHFVQNPAPPPATNALVSASATAPAPVTATVAPPAPPPGSINDNFLNRERDDHDSMTTMYARDWVIANGEKLSGITQVTAVPGSQVTILSSDGEKSLMDASLPQGFLDQWGITPAVIDAANHPKPPPDQ